MIRTKAEWYPAGDIANSVKLSVAFEEGGRLLFHSMHTTVDEAVSMGERWLIQVQDNYPRASVHIDEKVKVGWLQRGPQ